MRGGGAGLRGGGGFLPFAGLADPAGSGAADGLAVLAASVVDGFGFGVVAVSAAFCLATAELALSLEFSSVLT